MIRQMGFKVGPTHATTGQDRSTAFSRSMVPMLLLKGPTQLTALQPTRETSQIKLLFYPWIFCTINTSYLHWEKGFCGAHSLRGLKIPFSLLYPFLKPYADLIVEEALPVFLPRVALFVGLALVDRIVRRPVRAIMSTPSYPTSPSQKLESPETLDQVKLTSLTMVPQFLNTTKAVDLRWIACYNSLQKYKTRLICTRLKDVLRYLVDESQGAFVDDKSIVIL